MKPDRIADFDVFLIEDVILTLGNVRSTLAWLIEDGTNDEMRRLGLERLDRQIAQVEGRAHTLRRNAVEARRADPDLLPDLPVQAPAADAQMPDIANLFADDTDDDGDAHPAPSVAELRRIARALDDEIAALPVFRSRRDRSGD